MARNLLLALVATAAALTAIEVGLRRFLPPRADGWASIPPIEERLRALAASREGEIYWLAVGDSQTEFMDDVGQNWFRDAVRHARADGVALRGINLAQKGTGVLHYERNLRDYGPSLAPALVLIGLYLGNDVLDYEIWARMRAQGRDPPAIVTRGRRSLRLGDQPQSLRVIGLATAAWRRWVPHAARLDHDLADMAALYGIPEATAHAALARLDPEVIRQARREERNPWDVVTGALFPERARDLVLLRPGSPSAAAFEEFLAGVLQLDATCRRIAPACVFVVMPFAPQVHVRYHEDWTRLGHVLSADVVGEHTPLIERLRRFFAEHGISAVFPLADLRRSDAELFVPLDAHLNAHGQAIVGEAAYRYLRTRHGDRLGAGPRGPSG